MRLAWNIFARKLVFACFNSYVCIIVISIFETPHHCTIFLVVLLCSSQNTMSEFPAFFRNFRFHQSCRSGISISILSASVQTCDSAFSRNLAILYLSLRYPYNMLIRWLQQTLPHSINVWAMLDLQYVLSGQHCLHLLTIFPMNRCSYPILVCYWNAILYWCGIVSSNNNSDIVLSIVDPFGSPFQSSPLCVSPSCSATSIPVGFV